MKETLDSQTVFDRQQELCDNQLAINEAIQELQTYVQTNVVVSVSALVTNVATLLTQLNDVQKQLDKIAVVNKKNEVTIG